MSKLSRYVRVRGTIVIGYVYDRFELNGESCCFVQWGNGGYDPYPYREDDLENAPCPEGSQPSSHYDMRPEKCRKHVEEYHPKRQRT